MLYGLQKLSLFFRGGIKKQMYIKESFPQKKNVCKENEVLEVKGSFP